MTTKDVVRGSIFFCPICGAEIAILSTKAGAFNPHCCDIPMVLHKERLQMYICQACGAAIARVPQASPGEFSPTCCNMPMTIASAPA